MLEDDHARSLRLASGGLTLVGLAVFAGGLVWLLLTSNQNAVRVAVGGLVAGLVGSLVLLFVPDKVPPGDRDR